MAEEATTATTTEAPPSQDRPEASEQAPQPDFSEQFAALDQKLDQLNARIPEPQAADLLEDYGYEDEDDDDDLYLPEPEDPRLDRIESYLAQREADERQAGLQALADKYADFTEKIPEIRDALDDMGIADPAARGNPKIAERVYLSLKAASEDAAETPAEEARSTGARLETGAGASSPGDEPDPYESLIEGFGQNAERSVFE